MRECDRKDGCKYGNNIGGYCSGCVKNYEGQRLVPAGARNLFVSGEPIKAVLVSPSTVKNLLAQCIEEGREEEFYRAFYDEIMGEEHFREHAVRFDG